MSQNTPFKFFGFLTRPQTMTCLRWAIAAVFLVAAVGKCMDFPGLLRSIERWGYIPHSNHTPIAALLIFAEFVTGICMVFLPLLRVGAVSAIILSSLFVVVTGTFVSRGETEPCDCLGLAGKFSPPAMLFVDMAILVGGIALLKYYAARTDDIAERKIIIKNNQTSIVNPSGTMTLVRKFGLMVIVAEILVLMQLIPTDPVLAKSVGAIFSESRVAAQIQLRKSAMKSDPEIGKIMPPLPGNDINPLSASGNIPDAPVSVIVFVGHCTSCNRAVFADWQRAQIAYPNLQVIFVTADAADNVRKFMMKNGYKEPIFLTNDSTLEIYNVKWTPRVYAVNKRNRLIWIEEAIPSAVSIIAQQLSAEADAVR